jgi:hypothetical protein
MKLISQTKEGAMPLKLIKTAPVERNNLCIMAEIHRHSQHAADRSRRLVRYYSAIDNAIPKLTAFMFLHGYVGDVCEVSHRVTSLQIGTLKMGAKGHLIIKWLWDGEES